ncbi:MAG TPA: hypothetical protein VIW64_14085 [Pyrinomonadaceae bacterium]|jgi:hypothetical protein
MADTEVENILREIRERVYAEEEAAAAARSGSSNGARVAHADDTALPAESALPRLDSYLTTTARAWDRLPPVVSNRSGASARLELWLKRHFKRATRWYAWEQVNFNAAVHHALGEMAQLLAANEKTIADLREQLQAEKTARQRDLEQHTSAVQALRAELAGQVSRQIAEQRQSLEAAIDARTVEVDKRLAEIVNELRESIARLQDEQRVSYKQLSLEKSEAAVLEDRARRKTDAVLEELQRRVGQLEK